jgi:hypothetical protein
VFVLLVVLVGAKEEEEEEEEVNLEDEVLPKDEVLVVVVVMAVARFASQPATPSSVSTKWGMSLAIVVSKNKKLINFKR